MSKPARYFAMLPFVILLVLLSRSAAFAEEKLDAFEKDVNAPATHSYQDHRHHDRRDSNDDCLSSGIGNVLLDVIQPLLIYGGTHSYARIASKAQAGDEIIPRLPGEPMIPFARLDFDYQDVGPNIDSIDLRAESGYGPVAIRLDFTRYRESSSDNLNLFRYLGAYRMSLGSCIETDLGLGALTIDGQQSNTRFLFSFPVLIHPYERWSIELRPAWANNFSDYDIAVLMTWGYSSLKAGYRWIHSPNESLDGPYAGFSFCL